MVRRQGLIIIAAVALCVACKPAGAPSAKATDAQGPKIRATVVTIRTTLQPQNRTFTHLLVIANGRARSGDEVDSWRLFDLSQHTVTFVDDLKKSYRTAPLNELIETRTKALAKPVQPPLPPAQFTATGAKRVLQGVEAAEQLVRLGAYERRLWIGKHPAVPDDLFAMTQASVPVSSPLAGVTRAADEALMSIRGFPLLDHAELPFGNKKMVVERSVVKIEQKDVPEAWLAVPAGFVSLSRGAAAGSAVAPLPK